MSRHPRAGRRARLRLDPTTLLSGLLAGIVPACLLVVISYLYLTDLDPGLLDALITPGLARSQQRAAELGETMDRRRRWLVREFLQTLFGVTDEDGLSVSRAEEVGRAAAQELGWDLIEAIDWFAGDETSAPRRTGSRREEARLEAAADGLLEALGPATGERRGALIAALGELPIQQRDPIGFSYGLGALTYSRAALGESLIRELLASARDLDPADLRAVLELHRGVFRLERMPTAIRAHTGSTPIPPGSLALRDGEPARLLLSVQNPGGGAFVIAIAAEPWLRRCLRELEVRAPVDDGTAFRLARVADAAPEDDEHSWARWPVPFPFDRSWILEADSSSDGSPLLVRGLRELGWLHYLYGGLLLLALLTVASFLLTGLLSHRVESSRQKDDFVRLVSHELRTPIAAIRMIAETLSLNRVRDEAERREFLAQLEEESSRLTDLIERVLEYGRAVGEREVIADPERLVRSAVDRFRNARRAAPEIVVRSAQEFHPVLLDREAIIGVICNLLSNASKYSPSDLPIEVTVGEESRNLFIEVRDQGRGIRRRDQRRIFRPFYRGAGTGRAAGFGLGLAYCRAVAESHRGKITVQSSPGAGSRFTLILPIVSRSREEVGHGPHPGH